MLDPRTRARLVDAGAAVTESVPLSTLTTLRLGGPARYLVDCTSTDTLIDVMRCLDAEKIPVLVLAGGSNLVIGDGGFDGVVVKISNPRVDLGSGTVRAEAGAVWDEVVACTVAAGLGGLECLSGIPGSAGATPVQNVGAYGVEVGSVLRRVRLLDRCSGDAEWVGPEALGLGYRTSILKHSDEALVLEVELAVRSDGSSAPLGYRELAASLGAGEGDRLPAAQVRDQVLALRRGKGMVLDPDDHDTWSAGSFFTNPIVPDDRLPGVLAAITEHVGTDVRIPRYDAVGGTKLSAGWLIERAGFVKGFPGSEAAARLSTKHTLALTNRGSATTADLVALAREVRDGVEDVFGVRLHPEPVTVNCVL
ncbi:UDP-N-acetylmuramate dehydrogenase [Rhodococcus sp. HNM0563]|uniref:UDP-N-acetylmuramate dehydrogenase n=1 Tax=unclassified Rhodococcus (in: high G+C Gram-positive bacteria) TaxID=192944 RepID=UPI00146EACFF|nr:UDP-N-acetylmuramate dehydrogenase [Rhodococcus sp. F64268]MCK0090138.1 UDP-N-acetylmuramate dehydrogenase [Rhodococcus sp. F64268]NLU64665.1 UDP-N-acetylmuramate dehydrogenase [Rhodococcus sp. HNM0563]